MAEVELRQSDGQPSGRTVQLPDDIFDRPIDAEAVYHAVAAYHINQSKGTASTLTRSEVRGGGAKPYRQKGTGRARQGSIRAPHYEGGGVVFGPHPFRKRRRVPKQLRRAAICSVLSDRLANAAVIVIEPVEMDAPRTRQVADLLRSLDVAGRKVLVILDEPRETFFKSARNIAGVEIRVAPSFSVYDVLWSDVIIMFDGAQARLAEVWS